MNCCPTCGERMDPRSSAVHVCPPLRREQPYYPFAPPPNPGWTCPRCGASYAPWVSECQHCQPVSITMDITGNTAPVEPTKE